MPALLNVVPSSSDASDLKSIGFGSPDSSPNSAKIWRTCHGGRGGVNVLAHSADTQLTTEAVAKQQELVLRTNNSQEYEVNLYLKQALFQISPGVLSKHRGLVDIPNSEGHTDNDLARCVGAVSPTTQPHLPYQQSSLAWPLVTPSAYQLPSACRYPSTQGPEMLSSWLSARGILPHNTT